MKKIVLIVMIISLAGCCFETPTKFTEASLTEEFITLTDEEISMGEILSKYKGKKVLIDVWASWCKDCIVRLPKLKEFQRENPDVVYLFLSLDKSTRSWKNAIDRLGIEGAHFFMQAGKKGKFGKFLDLWWIPRYVVLDENGKITLYKATKITDKNIVTALKK